MRIALETLGCKLNQAETELLSRQFAAAGHKLVSPEEDADIYILNTCTVTGAADAKSRHLLRLANRRNPEAVLVVTGCYAERSPEVLAKIEGVKIVTGNTAKPFIYRLLEESGCLSSSPASREVHTDSNGSLFRTRVFIKIQDGCSNYCSYCIVPFVRGKEKSLPASLIIDELRQRVAEGYQEVVLTGTEIGTYNDNSINLKGLLERILDETDMTRLRLSSLQPQEITPELINLWKDNRLCPHFHLSLQSGRDSVLRRMNRKYNTSDFEKAVRDIRKVVPEAAVTTDIIAGFPGETEEEFEESLNFIRKIGFSRLHVFSYSPRPGTAADGMAMQIKDAIKTQRNRKLRAAGRECVKSYASQFLGTSMPILWEQRSGDIWSGYTPNYIKVYTRSSEDLENRITLIKLQKLYRDGAWGEINHLT
jgi:threonylcarbamoyladenosine tRNA methylthiotransferase MtaB